MSKAEIIGIAFADVHCGSIVGLIPPGFIMSTGSPHVQNVGQTYLWKCRDHLLSVLPKRYDFVISVGDAIEGLNLIELGLGLSENKQSSQVDCAEEVLRPFIERAREQWWVEGTNFHVGKYGEQEEQLAARFQVKRSTITGSRLYSWLHLEYGGVLFDIAHKQSHALVNRSMPMEREHRFALERSARKLQLYRKELPEWVRGDDKRPPAVIIRAHSHTGWCHWEDESGHVVSLPSFKLQDHYGQTGLASQNRSVPNSLGIVEIHIKDGNVHFIPHLYPHPDDEIQVGGQYAETSSRLQTGAHPTTSQRTARSSDSSPRINSAGVETCIELWGGTVGQS